MIESFARLTEAAFLAATLPVVLLPFFAAVAGLAALAAHYTVLVERDPGSAVAPAP